MNQPVRAFLAVVVAALLPSFAMAQSADEHPLAGLPLRTIGPAITSGRISDFAFHPDHKHVYYAAISSGGLFKTENNGTTWTPVFDSEGSYALGVVETRSLGPPTSSGSERARTIRTAQCRFRRRRLQIDRTAGPHVDQYGAGRFRAHISQIWIDPDDSDTVLVAAHGPLWSRGR